MAEKAPLKKDLSEGGFEAREKKAADAGRKEMVEKWKAAVSEGEQAVNENVERGKGLLSRILARFRRAENPPKETEELKENEDAMKAAHEKFKAIETAVEEQVEEQEMFERLEGKRGQKMVTEYFRYKKLIGQKDAYGQIGDVQFDEKDPRGQLRVEYADGSSLRKFPTGLVLRVLEGGKIEKIYDFSNPKEKAASAVESKAPPKQAEFLRTTIDVPGTLAAIEAAKSPAQFRAYLMDNVQLLQLIRPDAPIAVLARMSDEDLEKTRLELQDEIDGGVRSWQAELETSPVAPAQDDVQEAIDAGARDFEAETAGVQEAIDRGVAQHDAEEAEKEEQKKRRARLVEAARRDREDGAGTPKDPFRLTPEMTKAKAEERRARDARIAGMAARVDETLQKEEEEKKARAARVDAALAAEDAIERALDEEEAAAEAKRTPPPPPQTVDEDMIIEEAPVQEEPQHMQPPVPGAAAEKEKTVFDKLEDGISAAALKSLESPEAIENPKTFAAKANKLSAEKTLKLFVAAGVLSEAEAKSLKSHFDMETEKLIELRKKLSAAIKKQQREPKA